jgi:O-antigen/teichoic acid export membrane protein
MDANNSIPKSCPALRKSGSRSEAFLRNDRTVGQIKTASVRGAALTGSAQIVKFVVHTASTMVLARLLTPEDYGLIAMVTVLVGFLEMFKDAGLSSATVQKEHLTHEQVSTLFWINAGLGLALALLLSCASPLITAFYHEPRLTLICVAISANFFLGSLSIQHRALQRRQLRFRALAFIDIGSMVTGVIIGIIMAWMGFGYWALVGMTSAATLCSNIAIWVAFPWRPGLPRRGTGIRPMIGFGGNVLGFHFFNSFFRSLPQLLIGRFVGAVQLGLYNKAYTLLMLPIRQINGPIRQVVFPALSRLQSSREQLRRYYCQVYELSVAATVPLFMLAILFAEEIILVVLGEKWIMTFSIFRYFGVAGLFIALDNPTGLFLLATGRAKRYFRLGFLDFPFILLACVIGVQWGAEGVAMGIALMRCGLCVPGLYLVFRGTEVSLRDLWKAVASTYASAITAGVAGYYLNLVLSDQVGPLARLCIGSTASLAVYSVMLLVVFGRWQMLVSVGRAFLGQRSEVRPGTVSA